MRKEYKDLNITLTPQRLAILEYLDNNTSHPSATDIHQALRERFPTMSLATVYSTLDILQEKGVVQELGIDREKMRFDPTAELHPHLICLQCKTIVDIHRTFDVTLPEEDAYGYEVTGSNVDFYGLCPACRSGTGE